LDAYEKSARLFHLFPGFAVAFAFDICVRVLFVTVGLYAGVSLWKIRHKAVRHAQHLFLAFSGFSLFELLIPFLTGLPLRAARIMVDRMIGPAIASTTIALLWYFYLRRSRRVRATYGDTEEVDRDIVDSRKSQNAFSPQGILLLLFVALVTGLVIVFLVSTR